MRQPSFEYQLAELPVSFSPGSVDSSREIALSAIGVLAEEDFGPPRSTPTGFEMSAQRRQPITEVSFIPITFPRSRLEIKSVLITPFVTEV